MASSLSSGAPPLGDHHRVDGEGTEVVLLEVADNGLDVVGISQHPRLAGPDIQIRGKRCKLLIDHLERHWEGILNS